MGFFVDIPTLKTVGDKEGPWEQVHRAATKRLAVQWIRENIGWCDDDGNICLLWESTDDNDCRANLDDDEVVHGTD